MQLELFDIQTDNAGRKGKLDRATGEAGIAAAGQKASATGESGADFLASLRMVSNKSQAKSEDLPAAAAGLDLAAKDAQPIRLGDVLNEIIRAWPAGRRPINTVGADGVRSKAAATPDRAGSVLETGQSRHSMGRAKQGLDGFTTALIKRLSRGPNQKATPPVAGPEKVKTAATQEAMNGAMVSQALSPDKQSKGVGIRILNLKNADAAQMAPHASNPHLVAVNKKGGTDTEKAGERPVADDSNNDLQTRVRQAVDKIKATGIKGDPQVIRQTESAHPGGRVNRPSADEIINKTKVSKAAALKVDLPKTPDLNSDQTAAVKPAAATHDSKLVTENRPDATEAVKSTAPQAKRAPHSLSPNNYATGVSATEKPQVDAGKTGAGPELRSTRTHLATAETMRAKGPNNKYPESLIISRDREGDTFSLKAIQTGDKPVPAHAGKKEGARTEFRKGEGNTFSQDGLKGQAVRDAKGGEQIRTEVADAKIKPTESATATPKAQSASAATAVPEPDKTVLDRVSEARVLEQISSRIRLQPKNGTNEIRIHLKPETLGQMQLKVLAQDQTISVKMVAETAMARDIIENNIGQLRADLNALGLNVEKLDVEILSTGDPAEKDAAGQRGGFAKHGRGTAHHGGRDHAPGDDQARPTPADEDEEAEGTLIGVFA